MTQSWLYIVSGIIVLLINYAYGDTLFNGFLRNYDFGVYGLSIFLLFQGFTLLLRVRHKTKSKKEEVYKEIDGWLIFSFYVEGYLFTKKHNTPRPWGLFSQILVDLMNPGMEWLMWIGGFVCSIYGVIGIVSNEYIMGIFWTGIGVFLIFTMASLTWKAASKLRYGQIVRHTCNDIKGKISEISKKTVDGGLLETSFSIADQSIGIPSTVETVIDNNTLEHLKTKFNSFEVLLLIAPGIKQADCLGIRGIEKSGTRVSGLSLQPRIRHGNTGSVNG